MLVKSVIKKWKNLSQILSLPTQNCKICFNSYQLNTLFSFFHKNCCICKKCQEKLTPKFYNFEVFGYKGLSIFEYDDFIKDLIYKFKGCYDYELKDIFLNKFIFELKIRYKNYFLVPAPSFELENEERGFNHVIEIFSLLGNDFLRIIEKKKQFKQALHNSKCRSNISHVLTLNSKPDLKGKKILIVDDVFTTGSTVKAMIKLLEQLNPKTIEILVISKTVLK